MPAPTAHSPLVQLMAVVGVPMGRRRWVVTACAAGLRDEAGRTLAAPDIAASLDQALACGHVEHTPHGVRCALEHGLAGFCEAALAEGRLRGWQHAVLGALDLKVEQAPDRPPTLEPLVALTRFALCAGLDEQRRRELLARHAPSDPAAVYFAAFGRPFDPRIANLIPPAHREGVAASLLAQLLRTPQPSAPEALEWTQSLAVGAGALKYGVCEHLLWQGRVAQLESLLGGDASARAVALRAAAAALESDFHRSADLYAQAERLLQRQAKEAWRSTDGRARGSAKLTIPPLPLSMAFLRVAALVAGNEPPQHEEARRLCRQEARAQDGPSVWSFVEEAIRARGRHADSRWRLPLDTHDALSTLIGLAAGSWARVPVEPAERDVITPQLEAFRAAGYERAALELEAGLAIAQGRELRPGERRTVAACFADEPAWLRAIAALESLAGGPSRDISADETRIVWLLQERPLAGVHIEAREQKRGAHGWSGGRLLSSPALARSPVSAQDRRVFEALGTERYGASFGPGMHQALLALVAHPRVFFAEDLSTPVTVIAAMPELIVERLEGGGVRLRLPPELGEQMTRASRHGYGAASPYEYLPEEGCVLLRDSPSRVRVVRITRTHRRIAELLGPGLEFPPEGVEALKRTLATIAGHFAVHSDVEAAVAEVPADATVHAELTPAGSGLRLRLLVRPFREHGPGCTPGVGGGRVLAEIDGDRLAAVRDLEEERERVTRLLERLPVLPDPEPACEWQLFDPASCLQLVEALQSLGDDVRVEWPAGKPIRVTRAYGPRDLQLVIGSDRGWFAVSGGLTLDDGTVMQMRTLIELARAAGGRYLPLGQAGFLTLTEDLRQRLEELERLGEVEGERLLVPAVAAGIIADALEGVTLESAAEWQARIERLRAAHALEVEPPSTLQAQLRPYQVDGFRWMARLAHCGAGACLADDMGLGKTVQAIAMLLHRAPGGAALVLAPTSVCANWVDEIRRFAPTLAVCPLGGSDRGALIAAAAAFDVVICSYGLLSQVLEHLTARAWHTLVLDEAQAVKNFATRRAKAVLELTAGFRLATTGTPVENRLEELWMLFRFLNPGLLGSRERFSERFAAPIERRDDARARAQLRKLIAPFVLRRIKAAVLSELPERTEILLTVEPAPLERAFHEALRESALLAIADTTLTPAQRRFRVLAELMRLRRACCDPRLVAPEAAPPGAKLEAFAELAQELAANRHKTLVFSQFVGHLQLLRERLEALGLSYQYLDGSTPAEERARGVRAFQAGEGDFFLISLRAGGFGLNLTAADYVVICDPWWNPAVEDQAVGRAHRMGQRRPVTVYRLVVQGSIEERIMALHRDKRALAEGLFSGESLEQAPSLEELASLLRGAEPAGSGTALRR
jgi:superfamily II DNA or RNA helicase